MGLFEGLWRPTDSIAVDPTGARAENRSVLFGYFDRTFNNLEQIHLPSSFFRLSIRYTAIGSLLG